MCVCVCVVLRRKRDAFFSYVKSHDGTDEAPYTDNKKYLGTFTQSAPLATPFAAWLLPGIGEPYLSHSMTFALHWRR